MIKVKRKVAFQSEVHKRRDAAKAVRVTLAESGRTPRIAKLVALASRMQSMLESGEVDMSDVTQILSQIESGDPLAAEQLLPLVYDELRRLAKARMADERSDHTLQATALVHDAFLRLFDVDKVQHWDSRGHFFSAAAEAMRRILVDHARNRDRLKRGGQSQQLSLDSVELFWKPECGDILDLHSALEKFEAIDPTSAELIKLRCFAGQTQAEAAALMGISRSAADRRWAFARAWLYDALK